MIPVQDLVMKWRSFLPALNRNYYITYGEESAKRLHSIPPDQMEIFISSCADDIGLQDDDVISMEQQWEINATLTWYMAANLYSVDQRLLELVQQLATKPSAALLNMPVEFLDLPLRHPCAGIDLRGTQLGADLGFEMVLLWQAKESVFEQKALVSTWINTGAETKTIVMPLIRGHNLSQALYHLRVPDEIQTTELTSSMLQTRTEPESLAFHAAILALVMTENPFIETRCERYEDYPPKILEQLKADHIRTRRIWQVDEAFTHKTEEEIGGHGNMVQFPQRNIDPYDRA